LWDEPQELTIDEFWDDDLKYLGQGQGTHHPAPRRSVSRRVVFRHFQLDGEIGVIRMEFPHEERYNFSQSSPQSAPPVGIHFPLVVLDETS
jgi:hypothetical protein